MQRQQRDYQRLQSLYRQRLLEIKREGIIVELYHTQQILPAYLQCCYADLPKLQSLLQSKVSLQLCDLNGVPLIKIKKNQYFTRKKDLYDEHRVYLQNKSMFRQFQQGPFYILVKNNATIGVLSEILQKRLHGDKYFSKIEEFIGDDLCKSIHMEEDMRLEYMWQNDLNEQQNLAIQKAFNNHLTFVKGPPGCGKTKTVSRMVKLLAEKRLKVLVGSISNIANQTLITEIVRQVNEHNRLCEMFPEMKMRIIHIIINYSRKALQKITEQAKCFSVNNQLFYYILNENQSPYYHEGNIMEYIEKLQEGGQVPNSFWAIYMKSYTKLISQVDVVISTTINSFKLYKYTGFRPDVSIVDEAAQASWTDTYGFMAFGVTRMVFVGDEKQLRPTVIGDCNANQILKETMFDKLSQKNKEYFVHLVKQYRMHPKISSFSNRYIYQGKLVDAPVTLKERESEFEYFKAYPISFITHDFPQQVYEVPESMGEKKSVKQYYNQYEGSLLMDLLFMMPLEEWKNVGILTFYDMQCQILLANLQSQVQNFDSYGLTVKTIDGYQGGQKDYIIVSTVRCNQEMNSGFCTEPNRVNVALTRAKKGLIVFGNPLTLTQGKKSADLQQNIWGKFYHFLQKNHQVLTSNQWHQIIHRIKHSSEYSIEMLQEFYKILVQISQQKVIFQNGEGDDEVLQKNKKIKKHAKMLVNDLMKISQKKQQINPQILREKVLEFLNSPEIKSENKRNFKQQFNELCRQNFSQRQYQQSMEFIYALSHPLYQTFNNHHQADLLQSSFSNIRHTILEKQLYIEQSCEVCLKEIFLSQNLKNISTLKETQILKNLVSSKLMYMLTIECKKELQNLISFSQTTQSHKI